MSYQLYEKCGLVDSMWPVEYRTPSIINLRKMVQNYNKNRLDIVRSLRMENPKDKPDIFMKIVVKEVQRLP
jgi:hypothetical protein